MESAAESGDTQSSTAVVDARDFVQFLVKVVPAILEGDTDQSHELINACNNDEYFECIKKFLSDPQTRALIVSKSVLKDEEEDKAQIALQNRKEMDAFLIQYI